MSPPDRRLHAFRPDLAEQRLQGRVKAARFVAGRRRRVHAPHAPLRAAPQDDAGWLCELLAGDPVRVFETRDDWCWLRNLRDGYVGYVRADAIGDFLPLPNRRVIVPRTPVLAGPDEKSPCVGILPLTAEVTVEAAMAAGDGSPPGSDVDAPPPRRADRFLRLAGGGYVYDSHLAALGFHGRDPLAAALLFLQAPYVWGGNGGAGMDCSGLVQIALRHCGLSAPRDADLQEAELGRPVPGGVAAAQRGDLLFWRGHVAFHAGEGMLLHANAADMAVTLAPLQETVAGILRRQNSPVTAVRRVE